MHYGLLYYSYYNVVYIFPLSCNDLYFPLSPVLSALQYPSGPLCPGPPGGLVMLLPINGPFCDSNACLEPYLSFGGYDSLSIIGPIGV